jgi:transcriptional regulator with XRE-family HTH domain
MDSFKIGQFIASLRKEQSMTQKDLADKLNVTNKAVSKWETGEGYPEITLIPALAEILGVTVDELLQGEKNSYKKKEEEAIVEKQTTAQVEYLISNSFMKFKNLSLISYGLTVLGIIVFFTITLSTYYEVIGFGVQLSFVMASVILFIILYNNFKNVLTKLKAINTSKVENEDYIVYSDKCLVMSLWFWSMSIFATLPYMVLDSFPYVRSILAFNSYIRFLPIFLILGGSISYTLIEVIKLKLLSSYYNNENTEITKLRKLSNIINATGIMYWTIFNVIMIFMGTKGVALGSGFFILAIVVYIAYALELNRKCEGAKVRIILNIQLIRNFISGFIFFGGISNGFYSYSTNGVNWINRFELGLIDMNLLVFSILIFIAMALLMKHLKNKLIKLGYN